MDLAVPHPSPSLPPPFPPSLPPYAAPLAPFLPLPGKAYVVREQREIAVHDKETNKLIAKLSMGKETDLPGYKCQWSAAQNKPLKNMLDSPPHSWKPHSKLAKVPGANLTLHAATKATGRAPTSTLPR